MDGQGDPKKRARSVKLSGRADKCLSPSNCKIYLSQLNNFFVLNFQNIFVSNCKMHLSRIARCISPKVQNVFVPNYKIYLSQSAKCICLKLQDPKKRATSVKLSGRADKCLSPSNCKIYLS